MKIGFFFQLLLVIFFGEVSDPSGRNWWNKIIFKKGLNKQAN
jgi:hypothetical protein